MIPISLSLKNKKVLIVGGGHVALRKAQQYIQEHAHVTILSPELLQDFSYLDIHYINETYQSHYIQDMFLVYAATNAPQINHLIVLDCQHHHILCGSATYDEDASYYSVAYKEHSLGTIALSMHQKLPYNQPLFHELLQVLDKNQSKLNIMIKLRPYILKYIDNKKDYFEKLYHLDTKTLQFLLDSLINQKGYLYVYHPNNYPNDITFSTQPSLILSIKEYEELLDLLIFPIEYHITPLVLYDGIIYQKLLPIIPSHWINHGPLIQNKKDLQNILSFFPKTPTRICIVHPRTNSKLKTMIQKYCQVYDFNENIILDPHQSYQIIVMLMTHGQHYHDIVNTLQDNNNITSLITLLDNPQVIKLIESKRS